MLARSLKLSADSPFHNDNEPAEGGLSPRLSDGGDGVCFAARCSRIVAGG